MPTKHHFFTSVITIWKQDVCNARKDTVEKRNGELTPIHGNALTQFVKSIIGLPSISFYSASFFFTSASAAIQSVSSEN